jgi:aspartate aminotransferase
MFVARALGSAYDGGAMHLPAGADVRIDKPVSLNMNVRALGQSATLAINDISRKLSAEGHTVYRLGLGQSPFPVPQPVVEALKANAHEKDYLPAAGLPALCQAVADHHRRRDGVEIRPRDVLVGPGSKELMFLLQLVYYGELIVPTPCWVSYVPQAAILGRHVSLVPTSADDGWHMTAESLISLCELERDDYRPRILVLNYPSNPVGSSYTTDELKELAGVARKFQVIVLSDEIYGPLHHRGEHVSIARYYPEGTIISSGLSKWCGAGGWRLGTFAFPSSLDWLHAKMAAVASETYTSVSAPIQYAAVRAFEGGTAIEQYLCHARRILSGLGQQCVATLTRSHISVTPPVGAFYLFLDFTPLTDHLARRGIRTSDALCSRLLEETGVAVLPGNAFGRPPRELTARLAYVDFDGAKAMAASETVPLDQPLSDDFVELLCLNVMKATRLLADWANGVDS